MLKKILIGFTGIIAIILILAAFQPKEYKVSRSITIAATPTDVFPFVNNLKSWEKWSPWMKVDPNMQSTYEGPEAGEGSIHGWKGNSDVGSGRMTIVKSLPPELVALRLDFYEPMAGEGDAELTMQPVEGGTHVTWTMSGHNNYLSRIICMFMNMDKMIGGMHEKGLNDLKTIVEASKTSVTN